MRPENRPYLLLVVFIILLDQLSKLFIHAELAPGETMQVLDDFLRFTFVYNRGGIFGIDIGNVWLYTLLSMLAAGVVVVYFLKIANRHKFAKICLATVFGGAIGNLIDRIAHGQVIDFIDVNIFDIVLPPFTILSIHFDGFALYRWYIFNIADAAITVGLIGFIAFLLFQNKFPDTELKEKTPETS